MTYISARHQGVIEISFDLLSLLGSYVVLLQNIHLQSVTLTHTHVHKLRGEYLSQSTQTLSFVQIRYQVSDLLPDLVLTHSCHELIIELQPASILTGCVSALIP